MRQVWDDSGDRSRSESTGRARTIGGAVAALLLLASCATTSTPGPAQSVRPSTSTTSSTSATATSSSTSTPTTTPTAADQLAPFFAQAASKDSALRAAAVLVNGSIGAAAIRVTPATSAAVRAIDLSVVAKAIPAGLGPQLQLAVLVVYSELKSRRESMNRIARMTGSATTVLPRPGQDADDVLACLRNGGPAANRFATDLARARTLAEHTPVVVVAAPSSRAAGDLAVRLATVNLGNTGCASCGGGVVTELATVTWQRTTIAGTTFDGFVGTEANNPSAGIRFRAAYTTGKGWTVELNAC